MSRDQREAHLSKKLKRQNFEINPTPSTQGIRSLSLASSEVRAGNANEVRRSLERALVLAGKED